MYFILTNVFIAIVSNSYSDVHDEVQSSTISLKALKKVQVFTVLTLFQPVAAMYYSAKYRLTHKKRLLSETKLLQQLKKLPPTYELSKEEIRQYISAVL